MPGDPKSIGIFDSGVGGLTVLGRLAESLPNEPIVYLGDTARVPYGTKSADTVIRYARACAGILIERGIKMLVVACNTASAYALDALRDELDMPVIGVVEPGALEAQRQTHNKRVGVIGTAGTVASGQYAATIQSLDPDIEVFSKACPLFVPLAEEGWTDGEIPLAVARTYLADFALRDVDTVVLGCTHYPLLKEAIGQALGGGVTLVDSAEATARAVCDVVAAMDMAAQPDGSPTYRFLVSDAPDGFARIGRRFLGRDIGEIDWVDF